MAAIEEPQWLHRLPANNQEFHFIMQKSLTKSDIEVQQNRLLIPSPSVKNNLRPLLHHHERANGTNIKIFTKSQWCFHKLKLMTTWSTGSTVINGKDYQKLVKYCEFHKDDAIVMWAFRSGETLCLAIDKVALAS